MAFEVTSAPSVSDSNLVKLAREIAMDIQDLETILKQYSISDETWASLQRNQHFIRLLSSQVEEWNGALNTHERVRAKSAAMLEEWLPELNNRMHDRDIAFPAKIEAGKMLGRMAGIGVAAGESGPGGERFTVTINLGEDSKLITFDKQLPAKVIDHDPTE
jgi:hypothetical protein